MADPIATALENVEYRIECLPDDGLPEGYFASGNDEQDARVVKDIYRQLDNGNEWAWCTVRVVASLGDVEGDDYLGACSYASEADFKVPGGYWEDMKAEALDRLTEKLLAIIKSVPPSLLRSELESRGIELD